MPWSVWVVLIVLLASLNPYGSFVILVLCVPLMGAFSYVPLESLAATVSIAKAMGVKPIYVWPATTVFGAGLLCIRLALRKPENPFYSHAATLLLGFLLAAAISVHRLSGWAGI
jgi:hypothetical protein